MLLNLCCMALACVVSVAAYALDKNGDGAYQIGTAEDLKAFADLVNDGETYAWGQLTADIDYGIEQTMIGCDANHFKGTFDGQGHTIKYNFFPDKAGSALFRNVGGSALIQNLHVVGTITTSQKYAAGIAVYCKGAIKNCIAEVDIESGVGGDATHGGLVVFPQQGAFFYNCLVKVTINGKATENCGGLMGWADNCANIQNCFVINDGDFKVTSSSNTFCRNSGHIKSFDVGKYKAFRAGVSSPEDGVVGIDSLQAGACYNNFASKLWGGVATNGKVVTAEDVKSGKLCYMLNNDQSNIVWRQTIGEDDYPLPGVFGEGHKQVYASVATDCNGMVQDTTLTVEYGNTDTGVAAAAHTWDNGVCTTCGLFNNDYLERDPVDGAYMVKTSEDLKWCETKNQVSNGGSFSMKQMNDITVDLPKGYTLFNMSNWFYGSYNGQGYNLTVDIDMSEIEKSYVALFPRLNGTVSNLCLHGSLKTLYNFAGSVVGETVAGGKPTLTNVYSDVDMFTSKSGDATCGGILGLSSAYGYMDNVIFAGTLTGATGTTNCGGIVGWAGSRIEMNNVAMVGSIENITDDTHSFGRSPGSMITSNCWCNPMHGASKEDNQCAYYDGDDAESGALAYLLNGKVGGGENYYQTLGTDLAPYPFANGGHSKVYAIPADGYQCDGEPLGDIEYTNTDPGEPQIPGHEFDEGFCTVCGNLDPDFITPAEDGFFEISTPQQMLWWAYYASTVDLGAKGRLMEDIDMDGIDNYPVIGAETKPFYGSFDGQYHVVSNLVISHPDKMGVGFIGYMNSIPAGVTHKDADREGTPAYIRNLTLDETCEVTGYGYVGGILGGTSSWQGNVEVKNCVVRCSVTATGTANAGGIHGVCMGSTCAITVDNCGVTSEIRGPLENGVISGWMGSYGKLSNCWSISDVYEGETRVNNFVRATPTSSNNWWLYEHANIVTNTFKEEIVPTGELAWVLNKKQFKDPVWYQRIGEDDIPYLDEERGVVALVNGKYYSIYDEESLGNVVTDVKTEYEALVSDAIANKVVREDLGGKLDALDACADNRDLSEALDTINVYAGKVNTSVEVYKAYINKCEEIIAYLAEHGNFEGEVRDSLVEYLNEEIAPADSSLGSYLYIIENCEATDDEVKAETERVAAWLERAINTGYMPGADITRLVTNPSFAGSFDGWEGTTGSQAVNYTTKGDEPKTVSGAETWGKYMDMYQTVENLKPGIYLVKVAGAYRPCNDRYSYNYAATVYANDNVNYLMTVIEDPVMVEDSIYEVNCHSEQPTPDLRIYADGISTEGDDFIGYVAHGPHGLAVAGSAGRYTNYIATEVGEDGKLKIGFYSPNTNGISEWTGCSDIRLTYLGTADEATTEQVDLALNGQLDRIATILDKYVPADGVEKAYNTAPTYPETLKAEITAAQAESQAASTVAEKMACISKNSDLFKRLYEAKMAYVAYYKTAHMIETAAEALVSDLSQEEYFELIDIYESMYDNYWGSTVSVEEALNPSCLKEEPLASMVPTVDEEGTYHLSTPMHLRTFSAMVASGNGNINVVLDNDIDMSGIRFAPVGIVMEGSAIVQYSGTFDGQEHAITNLTIGTAEAPYSTENAALFGSLNAATVKNLVLQSVSSTSAKYAAGMAGYTYGKTTISNCSVDVTINSTVSGDGTHAGMVGVNQEAGTVIENCYLHVTYDAEPTNSCGGVVGWANANVNIKNCLVIADVVALSTSGCNSISRNPGNATVSNTYYTTALGDTGKGTQVKTEALKTGEVTWLLNGETADGAWFQTLGVDTIPHLFSGDRVWKSAGEYQNEEPVVELNAYAYGVDAETDEESVYVYYNLNANAEAVEVLFYNGDELVKAVTSDGIEKGAHGIQVANSDLGESGASLTYKVKVTGIGSKDVVKIGESEVIGNPYGLAVNTNPASVNFGQLLVTESRPTDQRYSSYKPGSLVAFDADFQPINAVDGTPGYYGGLEIDGEQPLVISSNYQFDLRDVTFTKDGRLFVARAAGLSASSVYEINPENLDEPWTPVFAGGELDGATGITYVDGVEQNRMAISLAFDGEGEDLKMYILGGARSDGEFNFSDFNCSVYNLGTAKTWSGAPSANFEPLDGVYTIAPSHVGIHADGQGGLWYSQYRSKPKETEPARKHYNAEGKEDYSDITTTTYGGKMAISPNGGYLALPMGQYTIGFYETDYAPNPLGKIFLTGVGTAKVKEDQFTGMAFDYAGNLYLASSGSKTMSRYTVPYVGSKEVVTPSNQIIKLGEATAIDGIKSADKSGAIYNIAGQRVSKAQNGIFIQNGKKVAVK